MHTPSLHRRVVAAGTAAVVLLAIALDLLLYFSWRSNLLGGLDVELASREQQIRAEAVVLDAEDLASRLGGIGVSATIRDNRGREYRAGPQPPPGEAREVRQFTLPRGMTASVGVARTEADSSLRRLLLVEVAGTSAAAVLAFLLLRLVSEVALQPLREITAAIRRTAAGQRGERLRPDQRHTRLGELAVVYDEMIDALEAALQDADASRDRSQRLQERAQKIVATANDAYVAADAAGCIIAWNSRSEAIFGWTAKEAIGRPLVETVVPPAARIEHLAGIERFLATGKSRLVGQPVELLALHRQGHVFPAELTLWVTYDDGEATFNAFVRDITEQRRMAEALDATLAELSAALDEAKSSEVRTRRFLADAAHQLRTPVAGIQACAETLLICGDPAAADQLLAHLAQETSRAGRLIKALLQTARLDQGMVVARRPHAVRSLCEEELDRARALAPELALRLIAPGWETRMVELDVDVVREILANLLDNARRHARSTIEVTLAGEGLTIEVRVSDDGPGLAPMVSDRAFDRFVSLDGQGGTGLGLPIARGLAEAHGGTLRYEDGAFILRLAVSCPDGREDGNVELGVGESI
jgi:PAS domain S-box-containing protein